MTASPSSFVLRYVKLKKTRKKGKKSNEEQTDTGKTKNKKHKG
jgi:hypothetical protein